MEGVRCQTGRCVTPVRSACALYTSSRVCDSLCTPSTLPPGADVGRREGGTAGRLQLGVASTTEKKLSGMGRTCARANPARVNKVANSGAVRSWPP